MGTNGPWITKSYLELILERKGWELDFVSLPVFVVMVHIFYLLVF